MISDLAKPDYREISLSNSNLLVIVDEQDYDYFSQWQWRISKRKMVMRSQRNHHYYLHREIAQQYQDDVLTVRHLNGNTLDNRRDNLKIRLAPRPYPPSEVTGDFLDLSQKQQQVAKLVSLGLSNGEIAKYLGVTRKTVECHVGKINALVGTNNRTQITRLVCDWGDSSAPEYKSLPPLTKKRKFVNQLLNQRLVSAQMIADARDAIAHQILQLQQIHADLEKTLQVMKP